MTDCIFCKIVNGEFGTEFVYDKHLLVVPRKHFDSLKELDDEFLLGKLMMTVKEAAKVCEMKSYRTVINTGKDAGQEVFHLHIHVMEGNIRL